MDRSWAGALLYWARKGLYIVFLFLFWNNSSKLLTIRRLFLGAYG
jgi:hypothetical protein